MSQALKAGLARRVAQTGALVCQIIAPAGYGKSWFAGMLEQHYKISCVCDFTQVNGAIDFAQRVLGAFAALDARNTLNLAQKQLQIDRGDAGSWRELLFQTWTGDDSAGLITFENTEHALANADTVSLLRELFGCRLQSTRVTVCTRADPHLRLMRALYPHEVANVLVEDLRFSFEEMRALFSSSGVRISEEALNEAYELTQGWPLAASSLLHLHKSQGPKKPLTSTVLRGADLQNQLTRRIIEELPPQQLRALVRCCVLVAVASEDLTQLSPSELLALPFIARRTDGLLEAHPLVRDYVLARYPDECKDEGAFAAQEASARGDFLRSAEIWLLLGDQRRAARAADRAADYLTSSPSLRFSRITHAIERTTLAAFPRLWAVATIASGEGFFDDAFVQEAELVWRGLPSDAPADLRASVAGVLCNAYALAGRYEEGLSAIESVERGAVHTVDPASLSKLETIAGSFKYHLFTELGRVFGDRELLERIAPKVHAAPSTLSSYLSGIQARVDLYCGDRASQRRTLEWAISVAQRAGLTKYHRHGLYEAYLWAWFAGEQDLAQRYLLELRPLSDGLSAMYESLLAAAAGAQPQFCGNGRYTERIWALLVGAFAVHERGAVEARLGQAEELSIKWNANFALRTILGIATAELIASRRIDALRAVEACLVSCEFEAWRAAFAAYLRGDLTEASVISNFVMRCRSKVEALDAHVVFALMEGAVLRQGQRIAIPAGELELLVYLAVRDGCAHREEIADALWPQSSWAEANNTLKVYVTRLRKRLGSDSAIMFADGLYQLGPQIELGWDGRSRNGDPHAIPEQYRRWPWFAQFKEQFSGSRTGPAGILRA